MDCVDDEGGVVIAYWTSLAWRGLALTWHSVARYNPDGTHTSRTSIAHCGPPLLTTASVTWEAPRLRCVVNLRPRQHALATMNLHDGVEWSCLAPAAESSITLAGRPAIRGTGYAERIVMHVPPWQLGIRELRWGRWISSNAARSAVWIEWTGSAARRWVFFDGHLATRGEITDDTIQAGQAQLALGERRTLHDRTLGKSLGRITALKAVVPKSLLSLRETKWVRSGVLRLPNLPAVSGTVIDEVAVFG